MLNYQRVNHPAVGVHPLKPPAVLLIQLDPENGEDRSRLVVSSVTVVTGNGAGNVMESLYSMDWFKENVTGKPHSSWEIYGKSIVSCRFSLKPVH
jgi:hypothetical protein